MRLRLLAGLTLLASLSFAGIHTFPPSSTSGLFGGGGPLPDEQLIGTVQGEINDGLGTPYPLAEYIICPAGLTGTANGAGLYSKSGVPIGNVVVVAVDAAHTVSGTASGVVTDGGTTALNVPLTDPYTPLVACESGVPTAQITAPSTGPAPNPVTITCRFTDSSPSSGPDKADIYWRYCPTGPGCGAEMFLFTDEVPTGAAPFNFSVVWGIGGDVAQPNCGAFPEDKVEIRCYVYDKHGNRSTMSVVDDVRLVGRGC